MMLSFVRRGVFGLLFAAAPHMMFAQATTGTVRGRVTDAGTGQGIANASVIVDGTRIGASTADNGTFSLSAVPTGTRAITVRRSGAALALESCEPVERRTRSREQPVLEILRA